MYASETQRTGHTFGSLQVACIYVCVCLFSGIMSTATSQQPPKDDEEEEDEEQGEEFEFDDGADEDKIQEDSKRMDCVLSTEEKSSEMLTVTEKAGLLQSGPPAGQEATFTKVSLPSAGKRPFQESQCSSSSAESVLVAVFGLMDSCGHLSMSFSV